MLAIALLLIPLATARADDTPQPPPAPAITDPTKIAQHFHAVRTRPEFDDKDEALATTKFEDMLSQWFKRLGTKIGNFKYASQMPAFESLLMTLLVGMALATLVYIVARLRRRRQTIDSDATDDTPGEKTFRPPEFYDEEIAQAVRAADWHTAWLASWRQFLSRLEHRHLVEPDRTRTNREYLTQLIAKPLPAPAQALLKNMVDAYDRYIYGRTAIGESDWNGFHRQIDEAGLLLHLNEKTAKPRSP